jgi:hypothetical protein
MSGGPYNVINFVWLVVVVLDLFKHYILHLPQITGPTNSTIGSDISLKQIEICYVDILASKCYKDVEIM